MVSPKKKKKVLWTFAADAAFAEIWLEKAAELRGPRKNSHIYIDMAQALLELGYEVRPIDVKYKIHNLTMKYRKIKAATGTGSAPVNWPLYSMVHRVIGNDRINNTEVVVIDSIRAMPLYTPSSSSSSSQALSLSPSLESTSLEYTYVSPPGTPVPPSSLETSDSAATSSCDDSSAISETIKSCVTESNKVTTELIELEKRKVTAIEALTESVINFLNRN